MAAAVGFRHCVASVLFWRSSATVSTPECDPRRRKSTQCTRAWGAERVAAGAGSAVPCSPRSVAATFHRPAVNPHPHPRLGILLQSARRDLDRTFHLVLPGFCENTERAAIPRRQCALIFPFTLGCTEMASIPGREQ